MSLSVVEGGSGVLGCRTLDESVLEILKVGLEMAGGRGMLRCKVVMLIDRQVYCTYQRGGLK
jgi:hypothetical protein